MEDGYLSSVKMREIEIGGFGELKSIIPTAISTREIRC